MPGTEIATPQKPKLLFLVAINTLTAICTQTLFMILLYGLLSGIGREKLPTLEATYEFAITMLLVACAFATIFIVASTYLFEKSSFFDESNMQDREISRAIYFSVIGMMSLCAMRALEAGRTLPTIILSVIIGLLLMLGRLEFREVSQGAWFPRVLFQYAIQEFVLCPIGIKIVAKILIRS
jgi:Na+/citrate or Na+/malate symporter